MKRANGLCVRKHVSPMCQRVSPFETLHALYLSGLCQRVTLCGKKFYVRFSFLIAYVVSALQPKGPFIHCLWQKIAVFFCRFLGIA